MIDSTKHGTMHAAPHAAMAPSDAVSATRRCRSVSTSITLVLILVYIPRWLCQPTDMLRYVRRSIPHPSMAPSVQLRGSLQRKRICTDRPRNSRHFTGPCTCTCTTTDHSALALRRALPRGVVGRAYASVHYHRRREKHTHLQYTYE